MQSNSQNLEIPERETETPGQGQGARARIDESQETGNSTHTDASPPNLVTQVSRKTDSRATRSETPVRPLVTSGISNDLDLSRFDGPLGQLPLLPLPSRAVTRTHQGDGEVPEVDPNMSCHSMKLQWKLCSDLLMKQILICPLL